MKFLSDRTYINWTFLFFFLFSSLAACTKSDKKAKDIETKTVQVTDTGEDFFVPSKLWDLLSGEELKENYVPQTNIVFAPVKAILSEKNPNVLSAPRMVFEFGRGGGDLDLARVLGHRTGTFFVHFEFQGLDQAEGSKIYYVSGGRRRKLAEGIIGTGCNKYFEVTQFFKNSAEGLAVNTTDVRHVTVLAGHFVFAFQQDKQIYVSQVGFKDSERKDLLCENILQKRLSSIKKSG